MDAIAPLRPAIGLVCKAPVAGRVKTRLAAGIGAAAAASLAEAFLRDTAAALAALPVAPVLVHAPADALPAIAPLLPPGFAARAQRGEGLGAVMLDALAGILAAGHPAALLVGADSPTAPLALYRAALVAVADPRVDAVFGPAADGGYWLVGMRHPWPVLFDAIPWSTTGVMAATQRAAAAAGLRLALLDPWYDVDEAGDLVRLRADLAAGPPTLAPATRAALAALSPGTG